ncbi:MAG: hypothetical protein ACFNP8_02785 [Alloprevotella sp.]
MLKESFLRVEKELTTCRKTIFNTLKIRLPRSRTLQHTAETATAVALKAENTSPAESLCERPAQRSAQAAEQAFDG